MGNSLLCRIPTPDSIHYSRLHKNALRGLSQNPLLSLFTCTALVLSATAQAWRYSLTVYHGILVLNMCHILLSTSIAPYTVSALMWMQSRASSTAQVRHAPQAPRALHILLFVYIATSTLVASFGLWLFRDPLSFDRTSPSCATTSTIAYQFGSYVHVIQPSFHRFWAVIYYVTLVPILNTIPIIALSLVSIFTSSLIDSIFKRGGPFLLKTTRLFRVTLIGSAIITLLIQVWFIVITEKTIHANNVGAGENTWTLGQLLAFVLALGAVFQFFFALLGQEAAQRLPTSIRLVRTPS